MKIGGKGWEEKGSVTPQTIGKSFSEKPAPHEALIQLVGRMWCSISGVDCKDLEIITFYSTFIKRKGRGKLWMKAIECCQMNFW